MNSRTLLLLCGLGALICAAFAGPHDQRRSLRQAPAAAAAACVATGPTCTCSREDGTEYIGADLQTLDGNLMTAATDLAGCCAGCANLPDCGAYTLKDGLCFFKAATGWTKQLLSGPVSGVLLNRTATLAPPVPAVLPSPAPGASPAPAPWPSAGPSPAVEPSPAPGPSPGPEATPSPLASPLLSPPATPPTSLPTSPSSSPPTIPTTSGCIDGLLGPCTCWQEPGLEYQGADLLAPDGNLLTAPTNLGGCCAGCANLPQCGAFTLKDGVCYFKAASGWIKVPAAGAVSGTAAAVRNGTGSGAPPMARRRLL